MFHKIGVLKDLAIFTERHCVFTKFLRTPFLKNTFDGCICICVVINTMNFQRNLSLFIAKDFITAGKCFSTDVPLFPANKCMPKTNNVNARKKSEICSKLT